MAKLILSNKDQGVKEFKLHEGDTLNIGRESSNDIILEDPRVSRVHASVYVRGSRYFITDLFSKNGTLVNGELVAGDKEIFNQDVINIGSSVIVLQAENQRDLPQTDEVTATGGFTNTKIAAAQFKAAAPFSESQSDLLRQAIKDRGGHNIHSEAAWCLAWWHGNSLKRMAEQTLSSSVEVINQLQDSIPGIRVFVFALSALMEDEEPSWKVNLMGDPIKICEEFNQLLATFSGQVIAEKAIVNRVAESWKFSELANVRFKKNFPPCELYVLEK